MRYMVVGTRFAETHIQWIQAVANSQVSVLAYQGDVGHAKAVATRYGIPRISDRPIEVMAERNVDAVVIVSPPDTHPALVQAGLANRLLVISDKPLAHSVQAVRELVQAAEQSEGRDAVMFQWRAHPAFQAMRQHYASGLTGGLLHINLEFHHDFLAGPDTQWPWRHSADRAGAGTLGDQGVHLFDLLRYVTQHEWRVTRANRLVAWPARRAGALSVRCDAEDIADVLLLNDRNAGIARIFSSRVDTGDRRLVAHLQGTTGTARVSLDPDKGQGDFLFSPLQGQPQTQTFPAGCMSPYRQIVEKFTHQKEEATALVADFQDGLAAQLLLEEATGFGLPVLCSSNPGK